MAGGDSLTTRSSKGDRSESCPPRARWGAAPCSRWLLWLQHPLRCEHVFRQYYALMSGNQNQLRPEEQEVATVLERRVDGVKVEQHDDGTEDGQYDLDVTGYFCAAVEVAMITDRQIREANAHWQTRLEPHTTTQLKWSWIFVFGERSAPGEPVRFPMVRPPSRKDLLDVLVRLEARGIQRIGHAFDYAVFEPAGWRIGDPDVAVLFGLLGAAAENASAVDLSHHGEPGGWSFAFSHGRTSYADADRFAADVQAMLHDDSLADMRAKLDRSGHENRMAALVYDSLTSAGWATGHLQQGEVPTDRDHAAAGDHPCDGARDERS